MSTTDDLTRKVAELVSLPCYDNGHQFTNHERIELIIDALASSPYTIRQISPLAYLCEHREFNTSRVGGVPTILVGSHVDSAYPRHHAQVLDHEILGTLDNGATNALLLQAMIDQTLPPNVLVVFNGDEERESRGINQAIRYLHQNQERFGTIDFTVILDVTFERGDGFTVENYFGSSRPAGPLSLHNERAVRNLIEECFPTASYYHHNIAGPDDSWEVDEFDLACLSLCLPCLPHPESRYSGDFSCPLGQRVKIADLAVYQDALVQLSTFLTRRMHTSDPV